MKVAEVALAAPVGDKSVFHYSLPDELAGSVRAGTLVQVPFGPRELPGVVFNPDAAPEGDRELKPIRAVLDAVPVVTPLGIALVRWISAYYSCTAADVLAGMLPPGLARRTVYEISRASAEEPRLTPTQRAVWEAVPAHGAIPLDRLLHGGGRGAAATVSALVRSGVLLRRARLSAPAGPKTVRVVELTGAQPRSRVGAKGQAVLAVLSHAGGPLTLAELGRHVESAAVALGPLSRQGLVRVFEEAVRRDPVGHRPLAATAPLPLTVEQARALRAITEALSAGRPDVFLLHGVTGSGKTEVYLQALDAALTQGRQGIVLVPEISLTPQTMDRFAARFPGRMALLHSALSEGERLDEWERLRAGAARAVVGARSAIFSPLENPGLIVLDEEHDASYKQDRAPRYHTREVALHLARLTGAVVVLGSATPDVDTYYRATHGEMRLLEMTQRPAASGAQLQDRPVPAEQAVPVTAGAPASHGARAGANGQGANVGANGHTAQAGANGHAAQAAANGHGTLAGTNGHTAHVWPNGRASAAARDLSRGDAGDGLPPVEVVDLRQELRVGNRGVFSRALQAAVREALQRREQAILFLNRRGSATFVNCRDCGYVARCPLCDLPYTYHKATEELICHRCDGRLRPPELCPRCSGWRIRYFGLGTQRVEDEARRIFPGARLLRWDRDVIGGRHGHEHVLDRFARGEADILVGTQMVAKGLDIPRVTVVGVISADTALNMPDFRASERTFQLLTQVAGRAGRHLLPGRVVVQTYTPEHFAIQAAADHDYAAFYEQEIVFRAEATYPPFARLLRLVYAHEDAERCRAEAEALAGRLRGALHLVRHAEVVGPAPCFIGKIEGRYLWQILVRADDPHPLLPLVPPGWVRDVDPVSLL